VHLEVVKSSEFIQVLIIDLCLLYTFSLLYVLFKVLIKKIYVFILLVVKDIKVYIVMIFSLCKKNIRILMDLLLTSEGHVE